MVDSMYFVFVILNFRGKRSFLATFTFMFHTWRSVYLKYEEDLASYKEILGQEATVGLWNPRCPHPRTGCGNDARMESDDA